MFFKHIFLFDNYIIYSNLDKSKVREHILLTTNLKTIISNILQISNSEIYVHDFVNKTKNT